MRLEHIAFNVKDVKTLAAWYVANLDMTIVREITEPPHMTFLADSAGKSLIEVYSDPAGEYPNYGTYHPVTFHLAYAVDDMDATIARLLAAGAQDGRRYQCHAARRQTGVSARSLGPHPSTRSAQHADDGLGPASDVIRITRFQLGKRQ